jgi:hypothetical protein
MMYCVRAGRRDDNVSSRSRIFCFAVTSICMISGDVDVVCLVILTHVDRCPINDGIGPTR